MEEKQITEEFEEKEIEEEYLENLEDFSESESLTLSKILLLFLIGIFSFLVFFIFLFPLDEVVKSFLTDFSKKSGIVIEFKELRFPLFGAKSVDGIIIRPDSNLFIKSEELYLDSKTLELLKFHFDGELGFLGFRIESQDVSINLKSVLVSGKLSGLNDRISRFNGDLVLNIKGGEIIRAPDVPLLGEVKKVMIQNGLFRLKFRNGKLLIDQGNLITSWFRFTLSGQIRLNDNIGFSTLDLKLCAEPQEKFAEERPDIAGILTLAPQENGKPCLPIQGTIKSPKIEGLGTPGSGGISTPPSPGSPTVQDGDSFETNQD